MNFIKQESPAEQSSVGLFPMCARGAHLRVVAHICVQRRTFAVQRCTFAHFLYIMYKGISRYT